MNNIQRGDVTLTCLVACEITIRQGQDSSHPFAVLLFRKVQPNEGRSPYGGVAPLLSLCADIFLKAQTHKTAHNFRSPEEITRDSSGRLSRPPSFQPVRFFESGTLFAPCHR